MNKQETPNQNRIWELDFFRGIALLFMVYFHIVFNLNEFYGYPVAYLTGVNFYIGKASVILFMVVSGISCRFSRHIIKNALKILGIAMGITLVTHGVDYFAVNVFHTQSPYIGIKFGILHFFGISMLLYPLLVKINRYVLLALGGAIIALGQVTVRMTVAHDYLFPLGIISSNFYSSDFYSLVPWLGVFIIGMVLGDFLYREKKSIFKFSMGDNPISAAGRNTLLIYVLHQPVIILLLTVIRFGADFVK